VRINPPADYHSKRDRGGHRDADGELANQHADPQRVRRPLE
jgi:hypothetical protein